MKHLLQGNMSSASITQRRQLENHLSHPRQAETILILAFPVVAKQTPPRTGNYYAQTFGNLRPSTQPCSGLEFSLVPDSGATVRRHQSRYVPGTGKEQGSLQPVKGRKGGPIRRPRPAARWVGGGLTKPRAWGMSESAPLSPVRTPYIVFCRSGGMLTMLRFADSGELLWYSFIVCIFSWSF